LAEDVTSKMIKIENLIDFFEMCGVVLCVGRLELFFR